MCRAEWLTMEYVGVLGWVCILWVVGSGCLVHDMSVGESAFH